MAGQRNRMNVPVDVCRRYLETSTPLPWSDVHLANYWHLSVDHVPILAVPVSGRAHCKEINRRRQHLPLNLLQDSRYAMGHVFLRRA